VGQREGEAPMDYLDGNESDFNMLSLRDLLDARDLYHVHLLHKANVIATAIGRYRIRRAEAWPTSSHPTTGTRRSAPHPKGKRTLDNSEVRPYSWPCLLVFVAKWVDESDVGRALQAGDYVPPAVYLPDGRTVPICVVEAPLDPYAPPPAQNLMFPTNLIGGGYPVLARVQGEEHFASIGCLVTDGHLTYALTNRHVAGAPGEQVYSVLGGNETVIGTASAKQLSRLPFAEVYGDFPGKDLYVNLDIGLIEIEDQNQWTAQVYGVGTVGELADLSVHNLSLRLIGAPVRGYGAASREMRGEIQGLFYRFKSVGGFEYTADFLIGPRKGEVLATHPGDSGTLWLLESTSRTDPPRPLAVQWGGHVFVEGNGRKHAPYALATCLSTVCNLLEVDVVRDWNIGNPDYWGAVGHYTIAAKACDLVTNPNLKKLLQANEDRISFPQEDISKKNTQGLSNQAFIPLADVPDLAWKRGPANRGNPEHPNHFADMDHPAPGGTLLDLCKGHPENVSVAVWQKYYDAVKDPSRGLLPFRVWQFYQGMVEYVKAGDVERFVAAAGIVSHYVGDACQPLHISYLFDGDPDDTEEVQKKVKGVDKTITQPRAAGVHSAYEDTMVDYNTDAIMKGIDAAPADTSWKTVKGGQAAAVAVVTLMQKTFATIQPRAIVDAYLDLKGKHPKDIAAGLWDKFGTDTIDVMAEGCRCLAMLWDSAWKEGGGDATIKKLGALDEASLAQIYQDRTFMPSKTLDQIEPILEGKSTNGTSPAPRKTTNGHTASKAPKSKRKSAVHASRTSRTSAAKHRRA
jgi:hypothetical protein